LHVLKFRLVDFAVRLDLNINASVFSLFFLFCEQMRLTSLILVRTHLWQNKLTVPFCWWILFLESMRMLGQSFLPFRDLEFAQLRLYFLLELDTLVGVNQHAILPRLRMTDQTLLRIHI